MNEDQIKHMVDRFLGWKLPSSFTPDNGISFERIAGAGGPHPFAREPTGTNLFDATQADAMVRYMTEGMPVAQVREAEVKSLIAKLRARAINLRMHGINAVGEANVGPIQGFFDWQVAAELERLDALTAERPEAAGVPGEQVDPGRPVPPHGSGP